MESKTCSTCKIEKKSKKFTTNTQNVHFVIAQEN